MKLKQTVIGSMLLAAAMGSSALSIGRMRGAAWIGQALDVSVPVRLEAGEDGSSLCFEADVFHADVRIDPRYVRVQAESAPNTSEAREVVVRVRSSTIVDEPVVTVYLKVGCDQKITRRLVLLAELPTETSSAIVAAPLAVTPVPSLVAPAPAPGMPAAPVARAPAPVSAARPPASTLPSAPAAARAPRPPRPAAPSPAAAPSVAAAAAAPVAPPAAAAANTAVPKPSRPGAEAPKAAAAAVPKARLKLDPAEMPPERDSTLRSTGMLASVPEENDQKRAEAAALWRSITAQPEDVLRDTQRLQSLEVSINALRSQMMQNQTNISDLKNQLEKAQTERYANPLVYALVVLLLAALGAMAYVWQRSRRGGGARNADWWRDVDHRSPMTVQVPHGPPPDGGEAPPTVKTRARTPPPVAAPQVEELDLDLGVEDLPPLPVQPSAPFQAAHLPRRVHNTDFASSFGGSGRSVNTEELFDIHQQADFFLSLGQHDQAIGVLLAHIRDNPETSALAYLDLFRIYHQQNRREPYEKLRTEFLGAFSADVPEFDAFNEAGRGLDAYEETLHRIVELWGTPDVITLVEELIFRRPNGDEGQTFDLEAYKELLLLFAVALEVSSDDEDAFVMSGPDSAYAEVGGGPLTLPPLAEPPPREVSVSLPPLDLPLDIDLMLTESMVAPLDSLPRPQAPPGTKATDANGIEFELFDPSTEAQIAPRKDKT